MSVAIGPLARSTRLRSRPEQSSGVVPPLFDLAEGLRARTQPEVRGQLWSYGPPFGSLATEC